MNSPNPPTATNSQPRKLAAVIMAAGQGKRMQDPSLPKVLYPLSGQPLVSYVIRLTEAVGAEPVVVIIGYGREKVAEYLSREFPSVQTAIQAEQLGTGHAVQQTEQALSELDGDILVLSGDVPLLSLATTRKLIELHHQRGAKATILTVVLDDPKGYGRIVRDAAGSGLERIVEERDATDEIRQICEINSGIYVFDAATLFSSLKTVKRENAQGEYYLTDVFTDILARSGSQSVALLVSNDPIEVSGVNTKEQLQQLESAYLERQSQAGTLV